MTRSVLVSEFRLRATVGGCLLLTLLPVFGWTFLATGDQHLGHEHLETGSMSRELVILHHGDGDHHHEAPLLEDGKSEFRALCGLCARIETSHVLVPRTARLSASLVPSAMPLSGADPANGAERHEPRQPRAPPRI